MYIEHIYGDFSMFACVKVNVIVKYHVLIQLLYTFKVLCFPKVKKKQYVHRYFFTGINVFLYYDRIPVAKSWEINSVILSNSTVVVIYDQLAFFSLPCAVYRMFSKEQLNFIRLEWQSLQQFSCNTSRPAAVGQMLLALYMYITEGCKRNLQSSVQQVFFCGCNRNSFTCYIMLSALYFQYFKQKIAVLALD